MNEGFEIRQVVRLAAYNFYIRSVAGSGQLVAFNWQPTSTDRKRLGVADTGYPYEEGDIPTSEKHVFEQETGDLVILDGSFVHGVLVGVPTKFETG